MKEGVNRRLSAAEFERNAIVTDKLEKKMETALLGLVGEVGSLVSALKKKRRDTDGFLGYHDAVLEELGDVLWYVSAVARRGGTTLEDVFVLAVANSGRSFHLAEMIHAEIVCDTHSPGEKLSLLGIAPAAHGIDDADKNILEDVFGQVFVLYQEKDRGI